MFHKDPKAPELAQQEYRSRDSCLKAIERDPDRRYQTAGQLATGPPELRQSVRDYRQADGTARPCCQICSPAPCQFRSYRCWSSWSLFCSQSQLSV